MEMLQGVWKQHLRPRAVVGYGVKILLPSPPNYVTRSPGLGSLENLSKDAGNGNNDTKTQLSDWLNEENNQREISTVKVLTTT